MGALTLVLGASAVIVLIAATVASQARQDMRMASAERDASQVQTQVTGIFNDAAAKATDVDWPGVPGDPGAVAVEGKTPCTPTTPAVAGQAYPVYCRDILQRREVEITDANGPVIVYEIPVRVRWQAASDSQTEDTFGWILTGRAPRSGTSLAILGVFYYHRPCTLEPNYIGLGPCKHGG